MFERIELFEGACAGFVATLLAALAEDFWGTVAEWFWSQF
jgi:hypothetical protein